jgi:hypothetical protein
MNEVMAMLRISHQELESDVVEEAIFETIYFAAVSASIDLAIEHGPYKSCFGGYMVSKECTALSFDRSENYKFN